MDCGGGSILWTVRHPPPPDLALIAQEDFNNRYQARVDRVKRRLAMTYRPDLAWIPTITSKLATNARSINKVPRRLPFKLPSPPQASQSSPYNGRDGSDDEVNDGGSGVH